MDETRLKVKEILWLVSIGAISVDDAETQIYQHITPLIETICEQDDEIIELEEKMKGG